MVGGSGIGNAIGNMLLLGVVATALLIIVGIWEGVNYFFLEDTYESKTILVPDVVVKSTTVNGIQKSDTTYVYHLE